MRRTIADTVVTVPTLDWLHLLERALIVVVPTMQCLRSVYRARAIGGCGQDLPVALKSRHHSPQRTPAASAAQQRATAGASTVIPSTSVIAEPHDPDLAHNFASWSLFRGRDHAAAPPALARFAFYWLCF